MGNLSKFVRDTDTYRKR